MTGSISRLLYAVCLVLLVSGGNSSAVRAAGAGQEAPAGAPAGAQAEAARPTFSVGDEFWFSDGRSISVEIFTGEDNGRLVFENGSKQETAYYTPDLALVNVRRPFGTDQAFRPDNAMLSFPLKVGKTWGRSFRIISSDGSRSVQKTRRCEVVGRGKTAVPAGTFDAFRIECRVSQPRARRFDHEELHYAPAVGRIILRRTWKPVRTVRLTEFRRAK